MHSGFSGCHGVYLVERTEVGTIVRMFHNCFTLAGGGRIETKAGGSICKTKDNFYS